MNKLKIKLNHCYGIKSLNYEFDFSSGANPNKPKEKAYAIYAPNGLMKTSFAKTFDMLSHGNLPKDELFNRPTSCEIIADGEVISKHAIYVLKSDIDIYSENPAITNMLVNPKYKSKYDAALVDLDKLKSRLISALQKISKVKKVDIEQTIINDWGNKNFAECIKEISSTTNAHDLSPYEYATLFDPKAMEVIGSEKFLTRAKDFNSRYQDLFNQAGAIYKKGIFNPAKAEKSFGTLEREGFFKVGHRVHLMGHEISIQNEELNRILKEIHAKIDEDQILKEIRNDLARNEKTQALTDLIERLDPSRIEFLIENMQVKNQKDFRRQLWIKYINECTDTGPYLDQYSKTIAEIQQIESDAAQIVPKWTQAVDLFNQRFLDMPFSLSVENQAQAVLGQGPAKLKFSFKDGDDLVEIPRSELKTLSQGEKRALYLLNFIFEVELRKNNSQDTLFVIDDVADSFDYKNKHAILQYIRDLCNTGCFSQIILTHNFDFFRSLANSFVSYSRCLMVNKSKNDISFVQAKGINNYFIGEWKNNVLNSDRILCATIPFVRNLIEYLGGTTGSEYLSLTALLHWKQQTEQITVGSYLSIYNKLFNTNYNSPASEQAIITVLFKNAEAICLQEVQEGLNLEDKVVLSMAIRLKAEFFLITQIRLIMGDSDYWCSEGNQFGVLMKKYISLKFESPHLRILEKVSLTVSSNIHLNSFMYEPILDLTIEHLVSLYREITGLSCQPN